MEQVNLKPQSAVINTDNKKNNSGSLIKNTVMLSTTGGILAGGLSLAKSPSQDEVVRRMEVEDSTIKNQLNAEFAEINRQANKTLIDKIKEEYDNLNFNNQDKKDSIIDKIINNRSNELTTDQFETLEKYNIPVSADELVKRNNLLVSKLNMLERLPELQKNKNYINIAIDVGRKALEGTITEQEVRSFNEITGFCNANTPEEFKATVSKVFKVSNADDFEHKFIEEFLHDCKIENSEIKTLKDLNKYFANEIAALFVEHKDVKPELDKQIDEIEKQEILKAKEKALKSFPEVKKKAEKTLKNDKLVKWALAGVAIGGIFGLIVTFFKNRSDKQK